MAQPSPSRRFAPLTRSWVLPEVDAGIEVSQGASKVTTLRFGDPAVLQRAGELVLPWNRPGISHGGADRLPEVDAGIVVSDSASEVPPLLWRVHGSATSWRDRSATEFTRHFP